MPSGTALRGMLRTDSLRILRDRFLVFITIYLLIVFMLMRALIPWITNQLATNWDFDLTPYHPLIVSYIIVQLTPLLPGIVGGFLLLESREERMVKALLVSPAPLSGYITTACLVMYATGFVLVIASGAIIGLGLPPWSPLLAVALSSAFYAPAFALLIAATADNKVQAFAYMKLFGIGPVVVAIAYFVPEPWQWLITIYPPYCASKAYWIAEAGGGSWMLWAVLTLVTSAVWLSVLGRLFLSAARR